MPPRLITVAPEEGGQKLLQFLARRFDLPQAMLHRWIRTGQVRRNGARCKAFDRVTTGDEIRVPPFADAMARRQSPERDEAKNLPRLLYEESELLIFDKPAGLAVHAGTGHTDTFASRLAAHYAHAPFRPTPAHRLDRDTSGLLLVACSYTMLRQLHDAFAARDGVVKEYLTWVEGCWETEDCLVLTDSLMKKADAQGRERVHTGEGVEARCSVVPLVRTKTRSLLLVRLHTGRTHQIRVQLAARGHPILGDRKYGYAGQHPMMLLHAVRIRLPWGKEYVCLPDWQGDDAVPEHITLPSL